MIKKRINTENILYKYIVYMILYKEFLFDFLGLGNALNILIILMMIICIIVDRWKIPIIDYIVCYTVFLLFLIGLLITMESTTYIINSMRLLQSFFYLMFLSYLLESKKKLFIKNNIYKYANIILLINQVIVIIQIIKPGLIVPLNSNIMLSKEDMASGLFGFASTHSLAIFSTFVIVLDLFSFHSFNKPISVFLFQLVFSSFTALLNDNKAFFFILILALITYIIIYLIKNKHLRIKTFLLSIIILIILISCYNVSPQFNQFFNHTLVNQLQIANRALNLTTYVNGSDERFQIISVALSLKSTYFLGTGFGSTDLYQSGYLGFPHFGQSDFGSIVVLGGLFTYILIITIIVIYINHGFNGKYKKLSYISTLILCVLLSIYTQPFSQIRIAIASSFLLLLFRFCCEHE